MAWMLLNPQIHNTFASLGVQQGEAYKVNDDCLAILDDILNNLIIEDRTLRTFRRAIGFGQYIRKDLLPLLIHVKDDNNVTNSSKIIDAIIKILVNLTIPVECLISTDALSRTSIGRHTIFEINKMLLNSKEAFADTKSTKAVLDHMHFVVERGTKLEVEQCDSINNCLLLLRNILHIPENRSQIVNCSCMQNKILLNLFTQSMDKLLIYLMSCPQKIYWVVSMVQLIALMYKDQHVGTLQKLLNLWFEASLSDSSDDNESNTSPPNQSEDSSPMLTSDPTSDSSDNSSGEKKNDYRSNHEPYVVKQHVTRSIQNRNKILLTSHKHSQKTSDLDSSVSSHTTDSKGSKPGSTILPNETNIKHAPIQKQDSLQSEFSDYGYGTQVENQESISTSSNDDEVPTKKPVHLKPHMIQKPRFGKPESPQDKKEERRKKLIKRSKTHMINMKGLTHHSPSDDNISNILKEFTVDFLLKGYGSLVQDLYTQLLSNYHIQIDTSHFFWLVTYFLKFATQLELDYEHISPVLSINILSYLTFEGISLCEQLGINKGKLDVDMKPCLRRTHLVVTGIREFLEAVNTYKKINHLSPEDKKNLLQLQIQIASMENFKSLFLLLLREYNSTLQSKQYLQDLITTNHVLMLFLDEVSKLPEYKGDSTIAHHLKQYATVEVMHKYGLLLEEFDNNGKYVNDCIFTMMHHVGGDLDNIAALFQPHILKTFSKIWESDYEICDDWSDLIEYVIHKFINVPRSNSTSSSSKSIQPPDQNISVTTSNLNEDWPQEDLDALYWYYVESRKIDNPVENIIKLYEENGDTHKSKLGVINQLLKQQLIKQETHDEFIKKEKLNDDIMIETTFKDNTESHDIKILKEQLMKENMGKSVLWLQKVLIEACYSKIVISNKDIFKNSETVVEPVPYCYSRLNQSIPIIPWNEEQCSMLNVQPFLLLLHKLGFHLPTDTGKLFVRIPNFWTADYMFSIAQKLGPIDTDSLKFDINLLPAAERTFVSTPDISPLPIIPEISTTSSLTQYTPMINRTSSWYETVLQSKSKSLLEAIRDVPSNIDVPLVISIPDIEVLPCENPVPHLSIIDNIHNIVDTEHLPVYHGEDNKLTLIVNDECEHNSIQDTASVASDLTRMYVSDEEREAEDL